ncbi:MAG: putative toxin-antitoxin system toxin component, PIN family [Acidobacteria bacterium]|nr:putative toxin-antitoxin system toxin component, PIN family [Acidobacteriota bacterium]
MNDKALVEAVFDCNVYLQAAAREKSVAAECLRLVDAGLVRLYLSEEILAEVEDVLNRPEIKEHFPALTDEVIGAFLLRLRKSAHILRHVPTKFYYSRDPDDAPYICLAGEMKADYLVSRDRDLLDLMTAHSSEAKEFRQRFRPLRVIEPLAFLQEVRRLESESAAS